MKKLFEYAVTKIRNLAINIQIKGCGESKGSVLDAYVLKEPDSQNIIDIFNGEWSSRLPESLGLCALPGKAKLFEDPRVFWAEENLGSYENCNILELGPLEGGHSYMFQKKNANKVIAIEANTRAFLKCLCIKEVLRLDRVEFKLGDFLAYLQKGSMRYDIIFACGVLYHMEDPVRLIDLISKASDKVFIWTHYYDKEVISKRKDIAHKFGPLASMIYQGSCYDYSVQSYKDSLDWSGFCGGPKETSKWLTRESIMDALRRFGFDDIKIGFDHPDHPNGPAFAISASK